MTSTTANSVAQIRRILGDTPVRIPLTAAVSDTTDETITVGTSNITLFATGQAWEHDDGSTGAERRSVISTDESAGTLEAYRAWDSSTAVTHTSGSFLLRDPRFSFNLCAQAIQTALDADMLGLGLFEIVEHQITSSATSEAYAAPSAECEEFLSIAQMTASSSEPVYLTRFSRSPTNVDSALYTYGKYFVIRENWGIRGTDIFYVNCKHALQSTTLNAAQDRILQMLAAAYCLDWKEPRRLAGPTTQGDRTVPVISHSRVAANLREQARRLAATERSRVRGQTPPFKRFVKGG